VQYWRIDRYNVCETVRVIISLFWATLANCAVHYCQLWRWCEGSSVPDWLLYACLWHCLSAPYVPPVVVTYSFRDTIALPMTVGLFLLQARLPGTLCMELREPSLTADSFRQLLKTRLFAEY